MPLFLNLRAHTKLKTWDEYFSDKKVNIKDLVNTHTSWNDMMNKLFHETESVNKINVRLSNDLEKNIPLFPPPKLLFNAFKLCSLPNLKK